MQGREEELGFGLKKQQCRHIGLVVLTDLDFADDIVLLSEEIWQAQELLKRVETESLSIGLKANANKTKCQVCNQPESVQIETLDGTILEVVNDFKYLGSMTSVTKADVKCRKAAACRTCNKLNRFWKSQLNRSVKIRVFCTVAESVLLYGLETWTLTKGLKKQLGGCCTHLLIAVHNIYWSAHIPDKDLYGSLPNLSEKLKQCRVRLAGHCYRQSEEAVSRLVLWTPTHGQCD